MLLRSRADPLATDATGATALHAAARAGHDAVAAALVIAGASPSCVDRRGDTPLIEAATKGSTPVVRALLRGAPGAPTTARRQAQADLVLMKNRAGETALMRAAVHKDAGALRALLEAAPKPGPGLDEVDSELGFTALMYAASQGSGDGVQALLAAGEGPWVVHGTGAPVWCVHAGMGTPP